MGLAVLLGSGLWLLRWSGGETTATPDTIWYARDSMRYAGYSSQEARIGAAKMTCGAMQRARPPYKPDGYHACVKYRSKVPDIASPRFERIFTSRPGYALLTAPFTRMFGLAGFLLASAMLGVACGVAVVVLGLVAGLRPGQALLAEVMFFLLPTGFWASRLLAEPPMMLGVLTALIGTIMLLRGRAPVAASGLLTMALISLCVVKPANGVALAAALTGGAVLMMLFLREQRRAGLLIAGISAVVLVGQFWISAALHLPGLDETLQDTFTRHFNRPDVADPWYRLWDLIQDLWGRSIRLRMLDNPLIPAAFVFGAIGLFARFRWDAAWTLFLAGLTGALVATIHPLGSEADRLSTVVWIPVAFGLAALVTRRQAETGPSAPPASSAPLSAAADRAAGDEPVAGDEPAARLVTGRSGRSGSAEPTG